ncbi:hypothetical protein ZIOFF_041626 [Zingiber officinale]|uniref:Amidase domain-containing protein n=1 Tax=Zingiber officinale TaxID=94328 RepID=A0A8J5KW93_ZINOF|nr:hypothetical protein ZIOFF_041626 [Zingiber officinale]
MGLLRLRDAGKVYKSVGEVDLGANSDEVYLHPKVKDFQEQNVSLINPNLCPIKRVQEVVNCLPEYLESAFSDSASQFKRRSIRDFWNAYRSGETTPLVAERFLSALKESDSSNPSMAFFISYNAEDIIRQAEESTKRYEKGIPISAIDGNLFMSSDACVLFAGGTKWLHKMRPCVEDASCVKQLRSCGAILVGKTNMHELGAGTSGINPHYGATRNPYDRNKISGGSSSGSAVVVSAGLCPVALGVDGGGSVRMPAALCGVVGLKPTSGRVSDSGIIPLNWTVGMPGILSATIEDALIIYAAISNELPLFQPTLSQTITDVQIAKYGKWFNDSTVDIRNCCEQALEMLCNHYKWKVIDVTVPEIEEMRLAHYVTLGSECFASMAPYFTKLDYAELGWDARVAISAYGAFSSRDYLNAQRIRRRQMYFHMEIFKMADVIVTPTTGVTAYPLQSDALRTGELDYINGAALVRYSIAGNFLGLPAITVPVGYDDDGLPIGLQFIGKPWCEATLLHIAFAMQHELEDLSDNPGGTR